MKKRVIQALSLLAVIYENALYGGIIYGWASLVFVLKDAGYFSEGCWPANGTNSSAAAAANATYQIDGDHMITTSQSWGAVATQHPLLLPVNQTAADALLTWTTTTGPIGTTVDQAGGGLSAPSKAGYQSCASQDRSLNLAFTIGVFTLACSTLVSGVLVDRLGLRVTKLSGWTFTFGGLLCFLFSSPQVSNLIYPAMVACAIGGCMLLVANYQVGHLFKKMRSTVVTVTCGAFDASSFVFLAVKLCYDHGIATKTSFSVLAGSTVGILLYALLLLPKDNIPWPIPDGWWDHREGKTRARETSLEMNPLESNGRASFTNRKRKASKNRIRKQSMYKVSLHGGSTGKLSLKQCLLSTLFVSHLVWMSILQLRNWFFFITFNNWLSILADGDKATVSRYTNIFAFIQFGGILTAPLSGLILDRNKHKEGNEHRGQYADLEDSVLALAITTTLSNFFSVTTLVPILEVQFASFVLQTVLRSFLYSVNAAFLGLAFPSRYMGTMVGFSLALAAVFGLLEYPLFIAAQKYSNDDPFIINVILLVLSVLTYGHSIYTHLYIKKREKQLHERDGDGDDRELIVSIKRPKNEVLLVTARISVI